MISLPALENAGGIIMLCDEGKMEVMEASKEDFMIVVRVKHLGRGGSGVL